MPWQLRLVAFLTGLIAAGLCGAITWVNWAMRPRSRQEARERRARIRRINRKEEPGFASMGELIASSIIASWTYALIMAGMTVSVFGYFAYVAFG